MLYPVLYLHLLFHLAVSVPLLEEQALTIPISRTKNQGLSLLARANIGKTHTFNKLASRPLTKKPTAGASSLPAGNTLTPVITPLINIHNNELFSAQVTIGKGQIFNLDLDTGSSDTWVRGPKCYLGFEDRKNQENSCNGKRLNVADTTLNANKLTFHTEYGTANVNGTIYQAPVSIGGKSCSIPIGVSEMEDGMDDGGYTDGLMGLGFNSLSTISAKVKKSASFWDGLGMKSNNMFSFYFSNGRDKDNGTVTIGGYDTTKIAGRITWIPITQDRYWEFGWDKSTFSVGRTTGNAFDTTKIAIADTGTTLIILDDAVALKINQEIGATRKLGDIYLIDCNKIATAPPVTFSFGGANFTIPASVYVVESSDSTNKKVCFTGFSGGAEGSKAVILGDTFLRQYYSIFDKGTKRLGLALARHPK